MAKNVVLVPLNVHCTRPTLKGVSESQDWERDKIFCRLKKKMRMKVMQVRR